MSTYAILPIKSFEDAKSRLAAGLNAGPRRALAEAMFSDVLTALRRASAVDTVVVVSSARNAQRIAGGHGAVVVEDEAQGHNEAALLGIAYALEAEAERVLLVPGDCPLIDPGQLDELIAYPTDGRSALIIPDRHGTGTNALLLTPPNSLTPSFGPDSCSRHIDLAREQRTTGEVVVVQSLALDIDAPEDLDLLRETLAATRGGAAHTRGMLSQMSRSQS